MNDNPAYCDKHQTNTEATDCPVCLTLKLHTSQRDLKAMCINHDSLVARLDQLIAERNEYALRLDALRRIVSDWRACPGSDSEYGIETAFNQLVETLERDVETPLPAVDLDADSEGRPIGSGRFIDRAEEEQRPCDECARWSEQYGELADQMQLIRALAGEGEDRAIMDVLADPEQMRRMLAAGYDEHGSPAAVSEGRVPDWTHFGDPCVYCGVPHDDVPPGPCKGRKHKFVDKELNRHARCAYCDESIFPSPSQWCPRPDIVLSGRDHGPDCVPPDEVGDPGSCCCGGDPETIAAQWAEHEKRSAYERALEKRYDSGVFDDDVDAEKTYCLGWGDGIEWAVAQTKR